jgi:glyoxylase-like metal-dependent hydrolase (beta-lactamase superfamily II)/rhodanese-related sulfurtransferase
MAPTVTTDTLRSWLDAGRPVSILDVRSAADREQWAIPGSRHVDVYDALRQGETGALWDLDLPADRAVVTVCNAGRVSLLAADVLEQRGFDVRSLDGGMQAWSLAWNLADVPAGKEDAAVVQVRRTGKGCLSYVVASGGAAAVIDPSADVEVYVALARRRGWTVTQVIDTHVHADHLSRARALADRTGATVRLPANRRATCAFAPIADGERLCVGGAALTAIATPGHTDESLSFVLDGLAIFTGDTLFVDGVGRPDLHAAPDAARAKAQALFRSLSRLRALPADLLVLPAHTSAPVPFDGRPVAARLRDIEPWLASWLASEDGFVARVTSQLPPTPPNFARIVALIERGESPEGNPVELEAGANRCAVR